MISWQGSCAVEAGSFVLMQNSWFGIVDDAFEYGFETEVLSLTDMHGVADLDDGYVFVR
jgi:hypothetical protein